jgi:hypothetical protein
VGRSSATECRGGCTVGLWPTKKIPAAGGAPVGGFGRDGSGPQRGPSLSRLPLSARPPTDRAMWRRLLARLHPDAGGDDELFVWAKSLEELVARLSKAQHDPYARLGGTVKQEGRIPFDPHTDFDRISERALLFAPRAFGYGGVLRLAGGAKRTGTAKDHRGGNLRAARPHRVPVGDRQAPAQRPQDVVPDRQGRDALRGPRGANHREPRRS